MTGDLTIDATMGLERAEDLYKKVFFEYGDDSVAQLGGVHLACEQSSNLLTKILEWGRLMAYLEQSTRYIAYDTRLGNGRYRYYRDPEILESPLGLRYVGDMDRMFDTYAELLKPMQEHYAKVHPQQAGDSDFVWRQAVRAKAFDALRGMLPAASLSNVGIYGTGQAYEQLLLRMRAHPLPEARAYAEMMLVELRKVIPSFLTRVDRADRGRRWSTYLEENRNAMDEVADQLFGHTEIETRDSVTLVNWDPDAENRMVAAMLYSHTDLPDDMILARVRNMGAAEKVSVVKAYVGDRTNRRHRPGRALETVWYRFDLLTDYGAFRDLQRHRMLSIEWQKLTAGYGYDVPDAVAERRTPQGRVRGVDGAVGVAARRVARRAPASSRLRRGPGVQGALRHDDQRPGGDADAGTAHRAPGPSVLPQGVPRHALPDRAAGGPPRGGRDDVLRRPRDVRPRAAGLRTPRRDAASDRRQPLDPLSLLSPLRIS